MVEAVINYADTDTYYDYYDSYPGQNEASEPASEGTAPQRRVSCMGSIVGGGASVEAVD